MPVHSRTDFGPSAHVHSRCGGSSTDGFFGAALVGGAAAGLTAYSLSGSGSKGLAVGMGVGGGILAVAGLVFMFTPFMNFAAGLMMLCVGAVLAACGIALASKASNTTCRP